MTKVNIKYPKKPIYNIESHLLILLVLVNKYMEILYFPGMFSHFCLLTAAESSSTYCKSKNIVTIVLCGNRVDIYENRPVFVYV
jgi:hypothetical protein